MVVEEAPRGTIAFFSSWSSLSSRAEVGSQ